MPKKERLFLIDAMAMAYRAYYAFISNPLKNSKGENTSAIYGFVTSMMRILDDEKPDYIAVVFDTREPTFRHKMYPEYKAHREAMPEDLSAQLGKLKDTVRAFNIPLLELHGFEADDIIGTLARRAEKENVEAYLVTPDKDFMQLISGLIKMYKPGKSGGDVEIIEEAGVMEKFGVLPRQVIDVLALIGDKSDNIPGVPGVGEKTAIPLIQQYGTLESLYEDVEHIPKKGLKEKLIQHKELAFLSKKLVTIDTMTPIEIDFHALRASDPHKELLVQIFTDLDFASLRKRFQGQNIQAAPILKPAVQQTVAPPVVEPAPGIDITSDEHKYHSVTTEKELKQLCERLSKAKEFVFDTETTSIEPLQAELVGIAFAVKEREAYYVPIQYAPPSTSTPKSLFDEEDTSDSDPNHTDVALSKETVLRAIKPIMQNASIRKIGQNIKYDALVMSAHGVVVEGIGHDTMIASYILRPDGQHNLDSLAKEAFNYTMVSYKDLVGSGKNKKHITATSLEEVTNYAAEDADFTLRIYNDQKQKLIDVDQQALCEDLEFPLVPVLTRMETVGIALDVDYLKTMSEELEILITRLTEGIHADAGEEFNINSTQQLGEILFNKLGLPTARKTKTGFSTDAAVLDSLRGSHPIISRLSEYRQFTKLKSTYIDALPKLINPKTGRIHTSFNQAVASTGRLSSSDPNLQNIPIRSELGSAIRKAFVTGHEDSVLLSADYSQIELRVMAHFCGDAGLLEAFHNREDIHSSTAAKVFGVPLQEVSKDMRRKAKEVNFGIMYGIGPFGLANRLEISQSEAKEIIAKYFDRFPKVKQYIDQTIDGARKRGFVSTLLGRRRYLPDISSRNQNIRGNAERQAINMPIQGTAADMIKLAMINLDQGIIDQKLKSRMLLQVHDELVFEVPTSELATMETFVANQMRTSMNLDVPIEVEVGSGKNWLEAH